MAGNLTFAIIIAAVIVIIAAAAMIGVVASGGKRGDTFQPVALLPCGPGAPPEYAVDPTGRGAEGTVVWAPFNPVSRVQLGRGVDNPSVLEPDDAVTGIFRTNRVKKWADPYAALAGTKFGGYNACNPAVSPIVNMVSRPPAKELAPVRKRGCLKAVATFERFEPGRRIGGSSLLSSLTRVSPRVTAGRAAAAPAPMSAAALIDTAPPYGDWIDGSELVSNMKIATPGGAAQENMAVEPRSEPSLSPWDPFVSSRGDRPANELTALGVGLGSVHRDPRFEPGPQERPTVVPTSPAPGTHAGAPTLGAFVPTAFRPGPTFRSGYSYAQSGPRPNNRAEAVVTRSS